jgi:hypothetical protein
MIKKQDDFGKIQGNNDAYKLWLDVYSGISMMWDDSHSKLIKLWIEFIGDMVDKTKELSLNVTPKNYKEFYDKWMKTYENSFGKVYPVSIPTPRETLESFIKILDESSKLYRSWIEESEKNVRKTSELLKNGADLGKFKECYDMWMKSSQKMSDDFLEHPAIKYQKEIYGKYTGRPDFYLETFLRKSKMWRDSYTQAVRPGI